MNKVFDKDGNKINPNAGDPLKSTGLSAADLEMGKKPPVTKKDAQPAKGFLHVTMLKTTVGSIDGINSKDFKEGEEYDIPVGLYHDFVTLQAVEAGLDKKLEDDAEEKPHHHHAKGHEKAHKDSPKNK